MKPIQLAIIAIVAVAAVAAISIATLIPSGVLVTTSDFRIEYVKSGGIAGIDEKFVIEPDGTATFTSNIRKPFTTKVDPAVLNDLKSFIARNVDKVSPKEIRAGAGAADYFEYELRISVDGKTAEFVWVDEGVAREKISEALNLIHSRVVIVLESLIR